MTVEPNTFWLSVANIVLGAAVLLCVLAVAVGAVCAVSLRVLHRRRYRAELNHDMAEMFGSHQPGRRDKTSGSR